jgi:hypothetical protein
MMTLTHSHHLKGLLATALGVVVLALIAAPSGAAGKKKTETLRVFSKVQTFTFTTADGKVSHQPPAGPPQAGDVLEVDSLDYAGTHKKHAKRPKASDYVRCEFNGSPEPDCFGSAAIGGSLLRFHDTDVIGAIGRWKSGKLLSNKEVEGGSDVVLKLRRS